MIPLPVSAEANVSVGSGIGFDIGAHTELSVPGLSTLSVGVVVRNLFETIAYKDKIQNYTVDSSTGKSTLNSETSSDRNYTVPTVVGAGAAATLPLAGTLIAGDLIMQSAPGSENYMCFGVEQPLAGMFALRTGFSTGSNASMSIGAGIKALANLNLAYVVDSKDSKANALVIDAGFGF